MKEINNELFETPNIQNFKELIEDFKNNCGYNDKDAEDAAIQVIFEDYGL